MKPGDRFFLSVADCDVEVVSLAGDGMVLVERIPERWWRLIVTAHRSLTPAQGDR